jgi:hypothetical protein
MLIVGGRRHKEIFTHVEQIANSAVANCALFDTETLLAEGIFCKLQALAHDLCSYASMTLETHQPLTAFAREE